MYMNELVQVHGISIVDGKILLIREKDVWGLPGGIIYPQENNIECLVREVTHRIFPFCNLVVGEIYNIFFIELAKERILRDSVYWIRVSGNISKTGVQEIGYISGKEALAKNFIHKGIIEHLVMKKFL